MSNISGIVKSARKIMRQDVGTGSDELRILQLGWMLFLKIFSDKDKELELIQDDYTSPIPEELHWDEWAGDDEGMTGDELLDFVDNKLFKTLANVDLSTGNKRALLVHEVFANNYNYMKSGIHLRQVINKLNEIDFNNSKDKHLFGQIYESFLGELQSAGTLGEFYTPRAITQLLTELTDPQPHEKLLDPACGTGGYLTAALEHLKAKATTVAEREAIQHNVMGWEYKPLPYLLGNTNLILHDINLPNIQYGDSLAKPLTEYGQKDRVDVILANPPFGGVVSNNNENNFPQTYRTKESADLFLILMIHLLKQGGRAAIVLPDGSLTGDGVKQRIREKLLKDCNLHTIIRLPNSVFQPYASVATNLLFFTKGEPTKDVWFYEHKLPKSYKAYSKTKPIQLAEFDGLKQWWDNREENEQAWKVDIKTIEANGYNLDIKNPNNNIEAIQLSSTEYLSHLKTLLKESGSSVDSITLPAVHSGKLKQYKIERFLKRIKRPIDLDDHDLYQLVTIKLHHKGVIPRTKKKGAEIKSKMFRLETGDFILSGIDARNGAFGIVPEELHGAIVTNDFWYFELDESIIDKQFFLELTSTSWFDDLCKKGSDGTTQRIRLQKTKFFNQTISLPALDIQKKIVSKIKGIQLLRKHIEKASHYTGSLSKAILSEAFAEKTSHEEVVY